MKQKLSVFILGLTIVFHPMAQAQTNAQLPMPHSLYLGDIDGDGMDDFIQLAGNRIFVYGTDAGKTGKLHYYLPSPASQLIIGNFSGAGNTQICAVLNIGLLSCYASSSDQRTLWWWFQQGNFIGNQQAIVTDLDGDGRDDLLLYNPSTGVLAAYTVVNGGFHPMPNFDLGNLNSVAKPNMRFRSIRVKGGRGGIAAIDSSGALSWFYSVFDGKKNTLFFAFRTASNFVLAGYDVTTARIDDDNVDDVILHSPSGTFSFYHIKQLGNGLEPIKNISVGQLDTHDQNAQVYWARMMPNIPEQGGMTRDGALVYVPSKNQFVRSDARWDGSKYTYWWTYNEFPPPNDVGWPQIRQDKWAVLLCTYPDAPSFPNPQSLSFFQELYTGQGVAKGGMVDFFRDVSYGTLDVASTEVLGPFLETNQSTACSNTSQCEVNNCIAAAKSVKVANYFRVLVATSAQNGTQAVNGSVKVDICGEFPGVVAEEMLHTYGVGHGWGPASNPQTYGDRFDVQSNNNGYMFLNPRFPGCGTGGNVGSGPNLSMTYKDRLNWVPAGRQWTVTSGAKKTSSVVLAASSRPEANGVLMAKVNLVGSPGQYYTVEYRLKEEWDQAIAQSGVLVHLYDNSPEPGMQFGKSIIQSQLMQSGDVFKGNGVTVSVQSFDSNAHAASVKIQY
jgi:hypothetical protein